MNKIILDSNIWIAYLNKNDSCHTESVALLEKLDFDNVCITEYIIIEIVTVLKQKIGQEKAVKFFNFIEQFGIKIVRPVDFFEEVSTFFVASKENKLSFIDLSLFYLSGEYEIITFDKYLKKILNS